MDWIPTVPPVLVDHWRGLAGDWPLDRRRRVLTTVANLEAYGSIEVSGHRYGQKRPELEHLGDLPRRVVGTPKDDPVELEVAVAGADGLAREALRSAGWSLVDGEEKSRRLVRYQRYLVDALGEFSVAKEAYVGLRTGWFSDRSVCYLAAGRPVIVQDTGFARDLFAGPEDGLLIWSTPDEALASILDVVRHPHRHATAAHRWANDVFSHDKVLPRLLELARVG